MIMLRKTPPARRERRKRRADAPKHPHIHIGMWVMVKVWCGITGCKSLPHMWQERYFYLGPVVAKRGDQYLVECVRGMGSHWATRDQMFVRGLSGRY